jgi:hypothetical protein
LAGRHLLTRPPGPELRDRYKPFCQRGPTDISKIRSGYLLLK